MPRGKSSKTTKRATRAQKRVREEEAPVVDPAPARPEPEEDEQEAVEVEPVDSSPEVASTASPDASPAGGYLSDPEMAEEEATDETFDYGQYARKAKLPPLKDLWKSTHSMGIPHIDLSKGPDTFEVLCG